MARRLTDLIVSAMAIIALLPLLVILAFLVRIMLGAPVIFRQTRPGLRAEPFKMLKFRTMTSDVGTDGELLPDEQRLNGFGKFLRSTSLDEVPGLWSVLKGDMSLIGPRPLLMQYLPLYSPEQARRHEIRPGITGWAQVNGRNAISWEEKFALDVWYVDNRSMLVDLKIVFMTFCKVLGRRDISESEHVTMPVFTGSPAGSE